MSTLARSLIYWGPVWLGMFFLVPELLAHFGVIRLYTLSGTSWQLEDWWEPVRLIFEVLLAVLLLHICFRLSAAALVFVVLLAAVGVTVHLLDGHLL